MQFYRDRLTRYKELIEKGDIQGVIKRINIILEQGLGMNSSLAKLFAQVKKFNNNLEGVVVHLQNGDTRYALMVLNDLDGTLKDIHSRCKKIVEEEARIG